MRSIPKFEHKGTIMNQDRDKTMQNQGKQDRGTGTGEANQRSNPQTTERVQPDPTRGQQKPEGDKPTGSQQPKF
jgi:hypothetical protein